MENIRNKIQEWLEFISEKTGIGIKTIIAILGVAGVFVTLGGFSWIIKTVIVAGLVLAVLYWLYKIIENEENE